MFKKALSLMLRHKTDIVGQRFGRLLVIKRINNDKWGHAQWVCKCACGTEKIILGYNLNSGAIKSCGCLHNEGNNTKHGHTKNNKFSKIYAAWRNMIQRCVDPNDKNYQHYGGRGIKVCKRWMKFKNFLEDMGEVPKGYQIDRINNDGNYCKSNCRWVTSKINNRNKRNNHLITHNGKTQCLSSWAEEYQIPYFILSDRINKLGWSIERALTEPIRKRKKVSA